MTELTPIMKQYAAIKEEHQDAIVLFRLGDFYEMFGADAEIASRVLQIALTTRDKTRENPLPMCGVPYFAADSYITKLIRAGHRVAVCEQMEEPREAKGIVAREVVRVITPGTHVPENPKENSFIVSLFPSGNRHGVAAADISTGELVVFETAENIEDEGRRFEPREILLPESARGSSYYRDIFGGVFITGLDDYTFEYADAYRTLLNHLKVSSLEGFGCEGIASAISAAGALVAYIEQTQKNTRAFSKISALNQTAFMFMDASTQRNLELAHNLKDGSREGTLLWVLDETLTPMGGRFLRAALVRPLTDQQEIRKRLEAVECLVNDFELLEELRSSLRKVQDIERLATRITSGSANARDLVALKNSLEHVPKIRKSLLHAQDPSLKSLSGMIAEFSAVKTLIEKSIIDSPPVSTKEGGIIKTGFNSDVDGLKDISTRGKDLIAGIEAREKKRTGISSLKISYNKIIGYFLEVTKANLELVPDDYIRKQTLVGSERFVTPELKDYENRVLGSEERLKSLEHEVFLEVLQEVAREASALVSASHALASTDFFASLAVVAKRYRYVKPVIADEAVTEIEDGRHPVLERLLSNERFIPNSTYLDTRDSLLHILTGPNMAGKSTYMRQVALIVLIAQMGGFVPAASATIGITDRIFTRIGASDFLSKGQSTFMVEMIEAANIINNATTRSLIILDEVGRGTSTFDGISIAWAIAEHILKQIRARTLFATHYNELTELTLTLDGVRNYNVSVREWGDEIIFLRKIEEGPADKSYGIQVARLAGVPDSVLARAKEVLNNLEKEELNETGRPKLAGQKARKGKEQLDLFSSVRESVLEELAALDTKKLKQAEALRILTELQKKLTF
ncbi:MAG: DNA mismatch repair protein MutS [Thermodesulfovibrionales bacterium]